MKTLYLFLNDEYIGNLYVDETRGKEEFSFSFTNDFLLKKDPLMIDPELFTFNGRQYASNGVFGFVNDMIPDRFGRLLIERREMDISREMNVALKKLNTSDYLVKVNDLARMGGLRIKESLDGDFVNNEKNAIPPYIYLRDIENASMEIDANEPVDEDVYRKLLLPSSSLGGARPKANIYYGEKIYIAKFPSKNDSYDVELFEYIVGDIAKKCGIDVPELMIEKYSKYGHTMLTKRFDRDGNKRIHYMSALTALLAKDGESGNYSYIDLVDFIKSYSRNINKNLKELYCRMVFSYLINNTDNHLRNHAFLLKDNKYELSPMFDVNPSLYETNFELPFGGVMNKDGIIEESLYFNLTIAEADSIYNRIGQTVVEQLERYKEEHRDIAKQIDRLLKITRSRL